MSQDDLEFQITPELPEHQRKPAERALVAFDRRGHLHLLHCKGGSLEQEVDANGYPDAAELLPIPSDFDQGVWVFEGVSRWVEDRSGPDPSEGEWTWDHQHWREPNEAEWELIRKGDYDGLSSIWGDVLTLPELDFAHRLVLALATLGLTLTPGTPPDAFQVRRLRQIAWLSLDSQVQDRLIAALRSMHIPYWS